MPPAVDTCPARRRFLRAVAGLALAGLPPLAARASPAQPFTSQEVRALRATVQRQLDALAAGDAAAAYGQASPAIQRQFVDAEGFIAMVLAAYPMLVKPRSLAFLLPERQGRGVVQPLQLRDRQGKAWLANYQMEWQPGGGWRIAGCLVVADTRRLST